MGPRVRFLCCFYLAFFSIDGSDDLVKHVESVIVGEHIFNLFTFLLLFKHFLALLTAGALFDSVRCSSCRQVAAELNIKQLSMIVYVGFPFRNAFRTNKQ